MSDAPACRPRSRAFPIAALCIAAVALMVRAGYVVSFEADPFAHDLTSNSGRYDELGNLIAGGGRLEVRHGAQPAYPYVVAAVYRFAGPSSLAVRVLQALLGAMTAVLLTWIAWDLGGRLAGWIAGLLWATHWPSVFYGGELLPDPLGTALLVLALTALVRAVRRGGWAGWLVGALAFAGALLVKSNTLALAPFPFLAVLAAPGLTRRVRLVRLAASLCVLLSVVASVTTARVIYGESADSGAAQFPMKTIWDGNHATSDGINPFVAEYREAASWDVWDHPDDMAAVSKAVTEDLARFVHDDPGGFARLLLRKGLAFVTSCEVGNNVTVPWRRARNRWLSLPVWPGFGAILALGAVGLFTSRSRWRDLVLPLGWLLTWSATIVAILVAGRYRLPTTAFLTPFAGIGFAALVEAARGRDRVRFAALLGLLAGVALLTSLDPLGLQHYRIAAVLQMEAQVLERAGDLGGAEARYLEGVGLERAGASLRSSYGLFLIRTGREDEGLQQMRIATAQEPGFARLHKDLGEKLRVTGAPAEALPHLEEATRLDPRDGGAAFDLGLVHADLGNAAAADAAYTRAIDLGYAAGSVWLMRGVGRARQGELELARADLERAAELEPDECQVFANLGLVHERLGEPSRAMDAYLGCPEDPVNHRRACRLAESAAVDDVSAATWRATHCAPSGAPHD